MIHVDLLTTVLAKRQIHSVHLLTHDYGKIVAQELLARQAEQDQQVVEASGATIESTCVLNGG